MNTEVCTTTSTEYCGRQMHLSLRANNVNGLPIRYLKEGEGPPMLLLHGPSTSSATWKENIRPLANYFSVYAPDLPWMEDPSADFYSYEDLTQHVETIFTFISGLRIDRTHLVGHSIGGVLAALISERYPQKVHRLVLINSVGLAEKPLLLRGSSHTEKFRELEKRTLIHRPVLIITGESDLSIRRDAVCYVAARNPLARCVIVPNAGALLHEERAEAVNREIISFCTETPVQAFCG